MGCGASAAQQNYALLEDGSRRATSRAASEGVPVGDTPAGAPSAAGSVAGIRGNRKRQGQKAKRSEAANREVSWGLAAPERWGYVVREFDGLLHSHVAPVLEKEQAPIRDGVQKMKSDHSSYLGIFYETSRAELPAEQQRYTLVRRAQFACGVQEAEGAGFTFIEARYQALRQVEIVPDGVTSALTYKQEQLGQALLPGRGAGVADVPSINLLDNVNPDHISQGGIGDCWLLSAISALSEYRGAIHRLFKNSKGGPKDEPNTYTVTLYDLKTWQPVDIVMDESLCSTAQGTQLLGCSPSVNGDLWACYLEKAVAMHCGGWDTIDGGQCTHAWRLLTGCRFQFTFRDMVDDSGRWGCFGAFNPNSSDWEELANSPHDGSRRLWPMRWPDVGGGGNLGSTADPGDMFERMCAWDDENFIMSCGIRASSDTEDAEAVVDGYAYTILACESNAGGTEWDLIKLRNPWGEHLVTSGQWAADGPGWELFPAAKEACKPVEADGTVLWLSSREFFEYFQVVYLCAQDMSQWVGA